MRCSQNKPKRHSDPQAVEFPAKAESETKGDGERHKVVCCQIGVASNFLSPNAPQQTVGDGSRAVKELHNRADWYYMCDYLDNLGVLGEEKGYLVSEGGDHGQVEETNKQASSEGLRVDVELETTCCY